MSAIENYGTAERCRDIIFSSETEKETSYSTDKISFCIYRGQGNEFTEIVTVSRVVHSSLIKYERLALSGDHQTGDELVELVHIEDLNLAEFARAIFVYSARSANSDFR